MYILAPNQTAEKYPYSIGNLRRDNPNTSFPRKPSDELLAEWGVFPVKPTPPPKYNFFYEDLLEGAPVFVDGAWIQTWKLTPVEEKETTKRKRQHNERISSDRAREYAEYSDPLFFKWQRGEATKEEWELAVKTVQEHLPYVK